MICVDPGLTTLGAVALAAGGRLVAGAPDLPVAGISTDTRTIRPGDVYVALRGDRFDGHDFLLQAAAAGAAAALVDRVPQAAPAALPLVVVDETLAAYQALAREHRRRWGGIVVAVTGSNGKTTTKELTAAVLAPLGPVHKTRSNDNNEIGVPNTLLGIRSDHRAAVVEMGMRHAGEVRRLASIAMPDVGIVTNIGEAHLELLGSRDAIADAEGGELLEALAPSAAAVLPADDGYFRRLASKVRGRVFTVGVEHPADLRLVDCVSMGWDGSSIALEHGGRTTRLAVPLLGLHNVRNAMAALGAGLLCGLSLEEMAPHLASAAAAHGRVEVHRTPSGVMVIDDSYNANPTAMRGALAVLRDAPCAGRRIAVLGDMRELGPEEAAAHLAAGADAAAAGVDVLVAVGERAKDIAAGAQAAGLPASAIASCADAPAAAAFVAALARPGDVVLVKASRAMALEAVTAAMLTQDART